MEIKNGDYTKMYFDIVFAENFLYVLREKGSVDIWDFNQDSSFPKKHMSVQPNGPTKFTNSKRYYPIELFSDTLYLALSSDDILLVVRHIGEFVTEDGRAIHEGECDDSICPYRTVKFDVYKMDMNRGNWLEVKSLNDGILLLGGNQSFSVLAKDHRGYKANSIYFTDDYWDRVNEDYLYGGHDMGVFSLEDGCAKQFCEIGLQKLEPPPFWVFPDW
ncbi:probable F-box protein At1g44080 [Lycium barbarum]|uniref:probable F-box protein At1g44080 n=1 Tax=Lycium barbarum TaxID=112863 RepID=UPI00293F38E2|nr:probable F-box protein At1g44080 [Lycium barbarum]